ncbi:hypothetical protein [Streptomyces rubellomurinus]|uniref:Uncharacterized protein n=1 Tax=Streptomyces rubellomurinus (strain ATCC 31215) TaxID=359131 RepID=A0A0F2T680_STRR3|nr:hypothetical protein [Streptomyces rubellomurinus]KJS58708.1 hypothetical protein VM95_31780 [Streptomyces rubellomurinus]
MSGKSDDAVKVDTNGRDGAAPMSGESGVRRGCLRALGVGALVVAGFVAWLAYGWWDVRQPADTPMREGVATLDRMLEDTTAGIDPPVRTAYGLINSKQHDTGLNDEADRYRIGETGQIVTRISPARAVELSNRVEARWKQRGYATTRPAGSASTVKATTEDGDALELDVSADGRATIRIDLLKEFHSSPFTRPSGAPDGSLTTLVTLTEDPYWSR